MTSPQFSSETQETTRANGARAGPHQVVSTTTRMVTHPDEGVPTPSYQTKKAIFRTYKVLFYVLGIIEVVLGFRFLLKLIGANPASGFTNFIYGVSGPFATPFFGIVRSTASNGFVIEWSTLIAMAVYAIFVWLVVEFFQIVKPVNPKEVEQTVDNQ